MYTRNLLLAALIVIAGAGIWFISTHPAPKPPVDNNFPSRPVACTLEAKICPDGSAVGRTGPNCEFAACPEVIPMKSGIAGTVTLSPTCPVERVPPDPGCAPKPYSTQIAITLAGHTDATSLVQSDANGAFTAALSPGSYILSARGGDILPRCPNVRAEVVSGQYTRVTIDCDTGIR